MKLAIISDIHANLEALKAVMDEIDKLKPDEVICLGDIVGYGADPNYCVEIIRSHDIPCVMGNHDINAVTMERIEGFNPFAAKAIKWTNKKLKPSNRGFLKALPFSIKAHGIFFVHGSPLDPVYEYVHATNSNWHFKRYFSEAKTDIIAMGHTHEPFFRRFGDKKLAFNAGSVGQPRDNNPKAAFCLFDAEKKTGEIKRVEYDIDKASKKIIKAKLPKFLAERLFLGT